MAEDIPLCKTCGAEIPWGRKGRRPSKCGNCSPGNKARQERSYKKNLEGSELEKALKSMGRASTGTAAAEGYNEEQMAELIAIGLRRFDDPHRAAKSMSLGVDKKTAQKLAKMAQADHEELIEGSVAVTADRMHEILDVLTVRLKRSSTTLPDHQIGPALKGVVQALIDLNGGHLNTTYSNMVFVLEAPDGTTVRTDE